MRRRRVAEIKPAAIVLSGAWHAADSCGALALSRKI